MNKACMFTAATLGLTTALVAMPGGQSSAGPETVVVHNGSNILHALVTLV